jgi:hypothetical protein
VTIKESGSRLHWNYFLTLDSDAANLARYVEFSKANWLAYSIEMVRLLLAASSEVDVVAKQLCKKIDPSSAPQNITEYRRIIKPATPGMIAYPVAIPRYGLVLTPWINWGSGKTPDWWRDYNAVKHERNKAFDKANLSNTLNSIAALFVILLYYYSDDATNGLLTPSPSLFSVPEERVAAYNGDGGAWSVEYEL